MNVFREGRACTHLLLEPSLNDACRWEGFDRRRNTQCGLMVLKRIHVCVVAAILVILGPSR